MPEKNLIAAYRCLEIEPDVDRREVELNYRRMKALYSEGTLGTYGLLDEEERIKLLEELDSAYERINSYANLARGKESGSEPPAISIPPLDRESPPAIYLRTSRESRGISLKEIAEKTNIGVRYLSMIEEERYEELPAPVYLRGFVYDYARTIGVADPDGVAKRYLDCYQNALNHKG